MASTLSIIWARLVHDFGLYEHEFTLDEVIPHRQFNADGESTEEREERLHTEIAGATGGPQL